MVNQSLQVVNNPELVHNGGEATAGFTTGSGFSVSKVLSISAMSRELGGCAIWSLLVSVLSHSRNDAKLSGYPPVPYLKPLSTTFDRQLLTVTLVTS